MSSRRATKRYVVCLSNEGHRGSLEVGKIYLTVPDAEADRIGLIRIVDESGEDYLYSRSRFAPLKLPREIERALRTG